MFNKKKNAPPERVKVQGKPLSCQHCQHDRFHPMRGQLNTKKASLIDLDFFNPEADCFVCAGCGFVHWFLQGK